MAWQIDVGKSVIRRSKEFSRLQRFLVVETDAGNIYRQEAVSMIPPLFLNVQPDHAVIDLCAAPGSKTAQLIEALHRDGPSSVPSGFVLANDSDYKRAHMLIHQIKRLNSPNLIVTNHDAQMFPKMKTASGDVLKFDRVLCDVPCSGDATMRKNINVWTDWTVGNGNGLHAIQINILLRGIQLLKPGGRLVYSTCSLNPIENEAVIAEALRRCGSAISLVDVSDMLPELIRKPGVSTWRVQNKSGQWVDQPPVAASNDTANSDEPKAPAFPTSKNFLPSFFPPTSEEAAIFGLEKSVRVYPNLQNTGGFFIAVFEKPVADKKRPAEEEESAEDPKKIKTEEQKDTPKEISEESAAAEPAPEPKTDSKESESKPVPKEQVPVSAQTNEEVFRFLPSSYPDLSTIWDFYKFTPTFPGGRNTLLVRNATGVPTRAIYYVSPSLRPLLTLNDHKVKFVHAGLRMFSMQKSEASPCPWRVHAEAISIVSPHLARPSATDATSGGRYFVAKGMDTLRLLVENEFPSVKTVETVDKALYDNIATLPEGTFILEIPRNLDPAPVDADKLQIVSQEVLDLPLVYPVWRGKSSVNLMLAKQDLAELVHRVFGQENIKTRKTNNNGAGVKKTEKPAEATADEVTDGAQEAVQETAQVSAEAPAEEK